MQNLRRLRDQRGQEDDAITCTADLSFKVRGEDIWRLRQATEGRVFALTTAHLLIDQTRIKEHQAW